MNTSDVFVMTDVEYVHCRQQVNTSDVFVMTDV